MNFLANAFGNADKEAKALGTITKIEAERLRLRKEMATLNTENTDPLAEGDTLTSDQKRYNEILQLLKELEIQEDKVRTKRAQDFIDKRAEEKNQTSVNDAVKEETDLGKIRVNQMKDFNRNTDRQIENLGKTKHELRELNDLRKIEDKLRSELKSQGPEAEAAIRAEMEKVTEEIQKQNAVLTEQIEIQSQLDSIAKGVGSTFASVGDKISDAMARGKLHTLDFADILKEMVIELQKMIFKVLVLDEIQRNIEERIKKTRTSGGGNIIADIFGSFFGGSKGRELSPDGFHRASGGAVSGGQAHIVGERGPELFVPRTAGSITPSSLTPGKMGGSPINISQNLNFAVGITNTVRAEVMNMLPAIQNSTISAVAEAKQRGGKFSKAFGD